ncbi:MAG: L,D-transpeptidase family protein [Deltaproteobacteria bacterium]|nr:L,D-transpeptidase family protein [Deltaproteobacteria bacterium]
MRSTLHPLPVLASGSTNPENLWIYNTVEKKFDIIVIQKSIQLLTVYSVGRDLEIIKQFPCSTGKAKGLKEKEGDAKTPSGIYFVTGEFLDKDLSEIYGSRAFPLDYPNALDREKGRNGSAIWLHGTNKPLQPYQTNGCIALENKNIDTLKSYIRFNRTPVIIVDTLGDFTVRKNDSGQFGFAKDLISRSKSLESGTYHDYLALYHPDYLPDMAWWPAWNKIRISNKTSQHPMIKRDNLFIISNGQNPVAFFDQSLFVSSKKVAVGSLKLFLAPYKGDLRILAEEYQRTPFKKKEIKKQPPIILAGNAIQFTPDLNLKIKSLVDSWLNAWAQKKIKAYSSFYSKEFKSQNNQNLKQWIAYKNRLNKKYKYIKVIGKDLKIKPDKEKIYVYFVQRYKNNIFTNVTRKTLVLKKEKGKWKIFRERV